MTAVTPSRVDILGVFENGQNYHHVSEPDLQLPFSPFGLLFGLPRDVQIGNNIHQAYGGVSTYYVLINPGTNYNATIDVYGKIWNIEILFDQNNTDRFIFRVKHPVLNEWFYIRNATQLFYFCQWNTNTTEDSLYEAIILSNGHTFRSVLDINQNGGTTTRRRTPYCVPTQPSVSLTRFRNPLDHSEYIILRYEYLNDNSLRSGPRTDICVGDVLQNGVINEVVDVADYMTWERIIRPRGKRPIKQTVANYAST